MVKSMGANHINPGVEKVFWRNSATGAKPLTYGANDMTTDVATTA